MKTSLKNLRIRPPAGQNFRLAPAALPSRLQHIKQISNKNASCLITKGAIGERWEARQQMA
jgi:hypothetical protein